MKSLLLSSLLLCIFSLLHAQQPGTLDPSFGNKGTLIDSSFANGDVGGVVKVTTDGKILIGTAGPYKGFDFTFEIDAYLPDGSPDLSFGENGSAFVLFPDMKTRQDNAVIGSLALLPDGRILAAGTRYNLNIYSYYAFARFKPDGTVDSSFGTNGTAEDDFGYADQGAGSIVLQPDGKIVIASGVTVYDAGQYSAQLSTARFLPDGSKDKSYGDGGIVVSNTNGAAYAVALQSDGKIVAAGNNGNTRTDLSKFHLERYNPDGSYDKSFGTNGILDTKIGTGGSYINDVAIQDDGKIVVGGNSDGPFGFEFTVARYNTDGSLDPGFGTGGIVITPLTQDVSICNKVFITGEKKDKIVATGYTYDLITGIGDFAVVGYNSDGSLDPGFGNGGITITDIDAENYAYSADLQTDGKIVQFGYTSSAEVFQLHRAFARYYGYPVHVSLAVRIKRWLQNHTLSWNGLPAEDKIAYYSVEQSSNSSKGFAQVAKVSGVSSLKDYSITNSSLLQGMNYYRVKAVSTDGTIRYSEVVSADNTANTASVYPNPASDYLMVTGLNASAGTTIAISDALGKAITVYNTIDAAQYRCDVGKLSSGVYYLQVNSAGKMEVLKFLKE